MEIITSRANESVKRVCLLQDRKRREEDGRFVFEGVHLLEESLRFGHLPETVFATERAAERYASLLAQCGQALRLVSEEVYAKMSGESAPQGVLAVCPFPANVREALPPAGCVLLESVRDTGNLGSVLRTAAALGAPAVAVTSDCADLFSAKTVRASMGALFALPVFRVSSAVDTIQALTAGGHRVFAAMLGQHAQTLGAFPLQSDDCFVIGNEGNGISPEACAACTESVFIPMTDRVESLNASVASALFLWELSKARLKEGRNG